jgi:lipoprotein-releasing system permease protein
VNLISGISAFVIGFVTLSMVIVLSAINGIENLIDQLYTTFDSEIFIYPQSGKTYDSGLIPIDEIKNLDEVIAITPVLEDAVLIEYGDQRQIARLKAMEPAYIPFTGLDSMLVYGNTNLMEDDKPQALIGYGLKYYLGMPGNPILPLRIYAPKRGKSIKKHKEASFKKLPIKMGGAFSISVEFDSQYIIVPFSFAEKLFGRVDQVSAYELRLSKNSDKDDVAEKVKTILETKNLKVVTRDQKNSVIYQTTQSEKWASYAIITFVMLIAVFNVIASLTMLILEKRKDINSLKAMGADSTLIRRIFFYEGILINVFGVFSGLVLGISLVLLQQHFQFIPLEGSIVDYYPMELRIGDLLIILVTVLIMGAISTYLPVKILSKKYL